MPLHPRELLSLTICSPTLKSLQFPPPVNVILSLHQLCGFSMDCPSWARHPEGMCLRKLAEIMIARPRNSAQPGCFPVSKTTPQLASILCSRITYTRFPQCIQDFLLAWSYNTQGLIQLPHAFSLQHPGCPKNCYIGGLMICTPA